MLSKRKREFVEHMLSCEETGYTDEEFGAMIGISRRTCTNWRADEEVRAAFEQAAKEQAETRSIFGAKTFVWSLEEAIVAYNTAEGGEKRQWWKLIRDLTEPMSSASTRVDYSQWTDEDLEAEWSRRGLSETEAAIEAAKGAL